jgi:carbamoyl-phosphate synthase large subunit
VLVTGAGGPAGVSVIRALAGRCHVIAVDSDPLAAGLHLARSSGLIPKADDASFVARLLEIADDNGADAIIATLTEEMLVLSRHAEEVSERVAVWLPSRSSLDLCQDKWRFATAMREAGIDVPATALGSAAAVPGPWVVKPRFSRGSRDVHYVDRVDEVASIAAKLADPIVQTRVKGSEFTVDALVSRDGELVGAVPRWRLETKAGISTKGRTFSDDRVLEGVAAVVSALRLQGPANVQGFVDGDDVSFIEVNPRFSGGLPLSLAAGADLVGEYVRGILGLPLRSERLAYREGTTMTRHFEEIYT